MNTNDYLLCDDSNKYYKFIILINRLIGIRITDIAQIRSLVILLEKLELLRGSRRARHECPPNAGRRRIKRPSAGVGGRFARAGPQYRSRDRTGVKTRKCPLGITGTPKGCADGFTSVQEEH